MACLRVMLQLLILLLFGVECFAQTLPELEKGPFRVGFTASYNYDRARPPIFEQKSLPEDQQIGRPIQINIWYPSAQEGEVLTILDYFKLTTTEVDFKAKIETVVEVVEIVKQEQINSHGIAINEEGLKEFLSLDFPMFASRDLKPAEGSFPIIIIGQNYINFVLHFRLVNQTPCASKGPLQMLRASSEDLQVKLNLVM